MIKKAKEKERENKEFKNRESVETQHSWRGGDTSKSLFKRSEIKRKTNGVRNEFKVERSEAENKR
jgi:hypothetical protein